MKILLSAFACSPVWGSEPGVGWRWALALAERHDVVVLTHAYFREHIEPVPLPESVRGRIRFEYFDVAWLRSRFRPELLNSRLHYLLWQRGVVPRAQKLHEECDFDVVHHLTWGSFRFASFLWRLPAPFVFGPVGGGERAPWALLRSIPFRLRVAEYVRDLVRWSARIDPFVRACIRHSDLVLCKTEDTLREIPHWARHKALVRHEIGTSSSVTAALASPPSRAPGPFRLLFAGRLLGWKGAHLALRALHLAVARGVDATLTFAGDGPMRAELERLIAEHRLQDRASILGFVDRATLYGLYAQSDAFLFPSLHDSSGNVVLEAMAHALPVICLDLGGPPCFIDASCGRVIATASADEEGVVAALAAAIVELAQDDSMRQSLRTGAQRKARLMTWEHQIEAAYREIERVVAQGSTAAVYSS